MKALGIVLFNREVTIFERGGGEQSPRADLR